MNTSNIAIFVPHVGCPVKCSFCNQHVISGQYQSPDRIAVEETCKKALQNKNLDLNRTEIAFFGGSFTAIDEDYMISLLDAAQQFIGENGFKGIRISTRPDAINDRILKILQKKNVMTIELGAQSMDDQVLKMNFRGHTADDTICSSEKIKEHGFTLGLQMMTGLYGSSVESDLTTAQTLVGIHPDFVRIYPTIVLKETTLEKLFYEGNYIPQSLDESVELCCQLLDLFEKSEIPAIRLGLHASDFLEENLIAGPYHPAFRQLCNSRRIYKKILEYSDHSNKVTIRSNPRILSDVLGQKRCNVQKLKEIGIEAEIIADKKIEGFTVIKSEE